MSRNNSSSRLVTDAEIRETERYRIEESWSKTRPLINLFQEVLLWEHPNTKHYYVIFGGMMIVVMGVYYYLSNSLSALSWISIIALSYLIFGPFVRKTFDVAFDRMESEAALRGYHSDDHSLWNVVIKTHLAIRCDFKQNLNALLAFRRANSTKFTFHTTFVLFLLFILSLQLNLVLSFFLLVIVAAVAPGFIRNNVMAKSWAKFKESSFYKSKLEAHLDKAQILIGMKAPSSPPAVSPNSVPSLTSSQVVETKDETLGATAVNLSLKQEGPGLAPVLAAQSHINTHPPVDPQ